MNYCWKTPSFIIRRGDQCELPFLAFIDKDLVLTPEYIDEIELVVGPFKKLYSQNELKFDSKTNEFLFPLTQSETFSLRPFDCYPTQIRVKVKAINEGDQSKVYGYEGPDVKVEDSLSENIIG